MFFYILFLLILSYEILISILKAYYEVNNHSTVKHKILPFIKIFYSKHIRWFKRKQYFTFIREGYSSF